MASLLATCEECAAVPVSHLPQSCLEFGAALPQTRLQRPNCWPWQATVTTLFNSISTAQNIVSWSLVDFAVPMRHLARYDLHFLPGLAGPTSYGVRLMAIVGRTNPARDVFPRRRVWLCDRYYSGLIGTDLTPKLVPSRLYSCNPPRDRAGRLSRGVPRRMHPFCASN